jgi:predicted RNase H-like HicB family nuclease
MMHTDNDIEITVKPKNPDSNWVAVDENGTMISEGKTPAEALDAAKKVCDNFSLIFVPKEWNTYIL